MKLLTLLIGLLLLSVGCHQGMGRPPVSIPTAYENAPSSRPSNEAVSGAAWWEGMEDQSLLRLVTEVHTLSLDLQAAYARVAQAQALAGQAGALRMPRVAATGGAGFSHNVSGILGDSDTLSLNASLPVSYEVDWFQRHGSNARAADDDAVAAELDVEAMTITMTASVAEAYFAMREAEAQRAKLTDHLETNQTFLRLMEARYQEGLASAVDLLQQRQLVLGTQNRLRTAEMTVAITQQRLVALLGPEAMTIANTGDAGHLPTPPPFPAVGIPERLLESRPDLRAARLRVRAADARVGSALAARLPTLLLNGQLNYIYNRTEGQTYGATDTNMDGIPDGFGPVPSTTVTDGLTWNAGAQISVPLFDGGLGRANQDLADARLREAVHRYSQATRAAISEVERALAQEAGIADTLANLESQVELAAQTVTSARDRYLEGLTEYLQVLSAVSALQQAELGLLTARRQLLSARIQLYRTLGGAWADPQTPAASDGGTP